MYRFFYESEDNRRYLELISRKCSRHSWHLKKWSTNPRIAKNESLLSESDTRTLNEWNRSHSPQLHTNTLVRLILHSSRSHIDSSTLQNASCKVTSNAIYNIQCWNIVHRNFQLYTKMHRSQVAKDYGITAKKRWWWLLVTPVVTPARHLQKHERVKHT
jgi:hypothetical protein